MRLPERLRLLSIPLACGALWLSATVVDAQSAALPGAPATTAASAATSHTAAAVTQTTATVGASKLAAAPAATSKAASTATAARPPDAPKQAVPSPAVAPARAPVVSVVVPTIEHVVAQAPASNAPVANATEPVESIANQIEPQTDPVEAVAEPLEAQAEPADTVDQHIEALTEPVAALADPVEALAEPVEVLAQPPAPSRVLATVAQVSALPAPVAAVVEAGDGVGEPVSTTADWVTPTVARVADSAAAVVGGERALATLDERIAVVGDSLEGLGEHGEALAQGVATEPVIDQLLDTTVGSDADHAIAGVVPAARAADDAVRSLIGPGVSAGIVGSVAEPTASMADALQPTRAGSIVPLAAVLAVHDAVPGLASSRNNDPSIAARVSPSVEPNMTAVESAAARSVVPSGGLAGPEVIATGATFFEPLVGASISGRDDAFDFASSQPMPEGSDGAPALPALPGTSLSTGGGPATAGATMFTAANLAARWAALQQLSRLRPLHVALPSLSPPG